MAKPNAAIAIEMLSLYEKYEKNEEENEISSPALPKQDDQAQATSNESVSQQQSTINQALNSLSFFGSLVSAGFKYAKTTAREIKSIADQMMLGNSKVISAICTQVKNQLHKNKNSNDWIATLDMLIDNSEKAQQLKWLKPGEQSRCCEMLLAIASYIVTKMNEETLHDDHSYQHAYQHEIEQLKECIKQYDDDMTKDMTDQNTLGGNFSIHCKNKQKALKKLSFMLIYQKSITRDNEQKSEPNITKNDESNTEYLEKKYGHLELIKLSQECGLFNFLLNIQEREAQYKKNDPLKTVSVCHYTANKALPYAGQKDFYRILFQDKFASILKKTYDEWENAIINQPLVFSPSPS